MPILVFSVEVLSSEDAEDSDASAEDSELTALDSSEAELVEEVPLPAHAAKVTQRSASARTMLNTFFMCVSSCICDLPKMI